MQCRSHSWRLTSECLFVTACSMDEYAEKKTEKNLIVRSGISEAETTNNKRLRSTFCIEAIQTRSPSRPLCDSRASCHNCEMVAVVHRRPCLQHIACCSFNSRHIGSESRFLPTPPAFDAPVRGVSVGISPSRLVQKN